MKTTLVSGRDLAPELVQQWSRLQQAEPSYQSPYFRPEFTQAVAAVRSDVEVAVLEEGGRVRGFFPFQRGPGQVGRPVGGPLSDLHGLISEPDFTANAVELVRGCRLSAWGFTHLPACQSGFEPHCEQTIDSAYMDLSQGFNAYEAGRLRGSNELRETARKGRQLAKEVGPLRFEFLAKDGRLLSQLLEWKSQQYVSTGVTDVFSFPWTVALLDRLLSEQGEAFGGVLSALYAGDELAAVHFGLRSHGRLHWWFPAYSRALSRFSPGNVLLLEHARQAESIGVRRIDLGKVCEWKSRFMSGGDPVAEGSVDLRPLRRFVRRGWRHTVDWVRASPFQRPARVPARAIYQLREWLAFR